MTLSNAELISEYVGLHIMRVQHGIDSEYHREVVLKNILTHRYSRELPFLASLCAQTAIDMGYGGVDADDFVFTLEDLDYVGGPDFDEYLPKEVIETRAMIANALKPIDI